MSENKGPVGQTELERGAYAARLVGEPDERRRALAAATPWFRAFLAPWLPGDRCARMLDVPCGAGNLLFALRAMGYANVRGVDGDPAQVGFAASLGLPAEVGDAFACVQEELVGSVQRVFSLDFVEHLEKDRAVEFCRLARSRLGDRGMLIIRTPSADGPFGSSDCQNDITHKWGMTSGAGMQMLQLAGFDLNRCAVVQEAPVPYKWQNRMRLAAFRATTRALGAWLDLCGIGAPRVWTRSMWLAAAVE